ncbi:MAG: M24 family metallopeptidase, partial [Desulfobacterales bacterium]
QIKKSAAVLHTGLMELKHIIREGVTELEIDEYPIISPRFEGQLENGMVLALEPKFVFPQTGIVGLEDDYVMTAEGLKRLTLTDQSLIQI